MDPVEGGASPARGPARGDSTSPGGGRRAGPPPIAPPRGLAGLFDGYVPGQVPGEVLDTSKFATGTVYCNVYDLGDSETLRKINAVTTGGNNVLVAGVFHTGIEIFGDEWCFGGSEDDRSGVSCLPPRTHPQHAYRTTVPLGVTRLSPAKVAEVTARMARDWKGPTYNLIHNNCQNFANALCRELGVKGIPGWVDRAARAAAAIDLTSQHVGEQLQQTKELVRSLSLQVEESFRGIIPQDEMDAERLRAQASESIRGGFEAIQQGAEELGKDIQQGAEELGKDIQKNIADMQKNITDLFTKEAQRAHEETQENLRAFGRGLTQTFSALWSGPAQSSRRGGEGPVREDVRCPRGHGLRFAAARRGSCDNCGAQVQEGSRVLDCRQCDWYLCGPCSEQALFVPKPFGRSASTKPATSATASASRQPQPSERQPAASAEPAAAVAVPAAAAVAVAAAPPMDLLGDSAPPAAAVLALAPVDLLGPLGEAQVAQPAAAAAAALKVQDLLADADDDAE